MSITWSEKLGISAEGTHEPPDEDGIYVIAKIVDDIPDVRYVGKGNIKERLYAHMSDNEQNECLKKVMSNTTNVKVRYAVIEDDDERANAEYTYYKRYLDKEHNLCNEIAPSGEYVAGLVLPF